MRQAIRTGEVARGQSARRQSAAGALHIRTCMPLPQIRVGRSINQVTLCSIPFCPSRYCSSVVVASKCMRMLSRNDSNIVHFALQISIPFLHRVMCWEKLLVFGPGKSKSSGIECSPAVAIFAPCTQVVPKDFEKVLRRATFHGMFFCIAGPNGRGVV